MSRALIGSVIVAVALAGSVAGRAVAAGGPGPYFAAPFHARANSFTFGQTPSFTARGNVLSNQDDRFGIEQVWRSNLNGSHLRCLTCGQLEGSNGFAEERPGGGWILFHSWANQPEHVGGPGVGGYGSDLYVMRENGSDPVWLTRRSDPNGGANYAVPGGIPYDNYHAYWSPDGRHIAWVRTEAYPLSQGGQRWEIMLADFVARGRGQPHLAHVRVVGPAYGVYETQQWAPDGSGFLFTAFGPRNSPFQASPPGWMHQGLYFMRVYGRGASPAHPRVTRLTDDTPVYQEQAAFTPDMRDVLFMSNRNSPEGSWYDQVIAAAQATRFDATDPGSVGVLQFLADFSDPNFRSDLFMVDVRTHDLRELTDLRHVVNEFAWNAGYTKLLWTSPLSPSRRSLTLVGTFPTITAAQRRTPTRIPAPGLYGQPIDLGRVRGGASRPARGLAAGAPGRFVPVRTKEKETVPPVVASYAALWLQQLAELGRLAGLSITAPTLLSFP
jgi:hypothetical protein